MIVTPKQKDVMKEKFFSPTTVNTPDKILEVPYWLTHIWKSISSPKNGTLMPLEKIVKVQDQIVKCFCKENCKHLTEMDVIKLLEN